MRCRRRRLEILARCVELRDVPIELCSNCDPNLNSRTKTCLTEMWQHGSLSTGCIEEGTLCCISFILLWTIRQTEAVYKEALQSTVQDLRHRESAMYHNGPDTASPRDVCPCCQGRQHKKGKAEGAHAVCLAYSPSSGRTVPYLGRDHEICGRWVNSMEACNCSCKSTSWVRTLRRQLLRAHPAW